MILLQFFRSLVTVGLCTTVASRSRAGVGALFISAATRAEPHQQVIYGPLGIDAHPGTSETNLNLRLHHEYCSAIMLI
jgi:hypothetical protein